MSELRAVLQVFVLMVWGLGAVALVMIALDMRMCGSERSKCRE